MISRESGDGLGGSNGFASETSSLMGYADVGE